jgi:PleD family two-component response regulator
MYAACPGAYGSLYSVFCILKIPDRANFVVHQTLTGNSGRAGPAVFDSLSIGMPTRILIAEDGPAVRTALRSLLESEGSWEIIDVENGQDAIAKAQAMNLTSSFST